MTHVMFGDGRGGTIEWGWKRCTLRSYCADYRYMRREQRPALWAGTNLALVFAYACDRDACVNLKLSRNFPPKG